MSQSLIDVVAWRPAGRVPARVLIGGVLALGAAIAFWAAADAAGQQAAARAGVELTQLLRMMALVKLALVAGAVWLVDWRFRFPAAAWLKGGYLAGLGMMAAGPGLIWGMAHVIAGAVLLHGGLALLALLFWRDPGSPAMLAGRRARR